MVEPWIELSGRQFQHWLYSLADAEWSFVPTEDMEREIRPMMDRFYRDSSVYTRDYGHYLMLPAVRADRALHFRLHPSLAPESYFFRT